MRQATFVTLALFIVPPGSESWADVKICNDFRTAINVALAYEDKASLHLGRMVESRVEIATLRFKSGTTTAEVKRK